MDSGDESDGVEQNEEEEEEDNVSLPPPHELVPKKTFEQCHPNFPKEYLGPLLNINFFYDSKAKDWVSIFYLSGYAVVVKDYDTAMHAYTETLRVSSEGSAEKWRVLALYYKNRDT